MSTPTIVQTKDGAYEIPTGERGTQRWAREASLIAVAYRQAGDYRNADKWQQEYQRRKAIADQVDAGKDLKDIIDASQPDLLAPVRIVADTVGALADSLQKIAKGVGDTGEKLPLYIGALVVGVIIVAVLVAKNSSVSV